MMLLFPRWFRRLLCEKMAGVLAGGIPAGCEPSLSGCRSKKGRLVVEGGRVVPWKPAPKP
jgi:hypothetical protein